MDAQLTWTDLLDPDDETLRTSCSAELHSSVLTRLLAPPRHGDEPRPRLEVQDKYVFGTLVIPVVVAVEDRVYYQQVFLVLTHSLLLTVRKTPEQGEPFDTSAVHAARRRLQQPSAGMYAFHLVDEVAERHLTLVDDLGSEIDELEDNVEVWPPEKVRGRLSELRHDLLHIRRSLGPTRDAVRSIVDNRLEVDGHELFPREVELHFGDAYDKLLRASEGLELCRDLVAGVRDYHQAKVSNDQNEVMKRLTVVASILLVPTLIVGVYGQNLQGAPEAEWSMGYWWSWALIVLATVIQLAIFRKKRWI